MTFPALGDDLFTPKGRPPRPLSSVRERMQEEFPEWATRIEEIASAVKSMREVAESDLVTREFIQLVFATAILHPRRERVLCEYLMRAVPHLVPSGELREKLELIGKLLRDSTRGDMFQQMRCYNIVVSGTELDDEFEGMPIGEWAIAFLEADGHRAAAADAKRSRREAREARMSSKVGISKQLHL